MGSTLAILGSQSQRVQARAIHSLLGVINGICCDGKLNQDEVAYLSTWLTEHAEVRTSWPGTVVHRLVSEVLADGALTTEEAEHLCTRLQTIAGNEFAETGSALPASIQVVLDDDPHIITLEREFVFTGDFLSGTRAKCERRTLAKGGLVADRVTRRTNYLVIGSMGSPSWLEYNFGRKIEQAMNMVESGEHDLSIVRETDWLLAVEVAQIGGV